MSPTAILNGGPLRGGGPNEAALNGGPLRGGGSNESVHWMPRFYGSLTSITLEPNSSGVTRLLFVPMCT